MENQQEPTQNYLNFQQTPLPNATPVLVLGIVSIVGCFCYGLVGIIAGIISLILAKKDTKLYNTNPGAYTLSSYNNLKAGRTCAIVGLALSSIYVLIIIVILIIFGAAIIADPQGFINSMEHH